MTDKELIRLKLQLAECATMDELKQTMASILSPDQPPVTKYYYCECMEHWSSWGDSGTTLLRSDCRRASVDEPLPIREADGVPVCAKCLNCKPVTEHGYWTRKRS